MIVYRAAPTDHSNDEQIDTSQTSEYLDSKLFSIDKEYIIRLMEIDSGEIGNVVRGLNDHVYSISLQHDKLNSIIFNAIYINGQNALTGCLVELNTQDKFWSRYLLAFAV